MLILFFGAGKLDHRGAGSVAGEEAFLASDEGGIDESWKGIGPIIAREGSAGKS